MIQSELHGDMQRQAETTCPAKAVTKLTTNFESSGHEQGTVGVDVAEFSTGGDWDAGINSYDSPPGFYPRDDGPAMKFYENVADNVFHTLAGTRILSAENGAEVKGKVTFSVSGKSQGCALSGTSLPTGSI